jgi:hypothetical protein
MSAWMLAIRCGQLGELAALVALPALLLLLLLLRLGRLEELLLLWRCVLGALCESDACQTPITTQKGSKACGQ